MGNTFGHLSDCNIKYCSNRLNISGKDAGGICGNQAGYEQGTLIIEYCWNEGKIGGSRSGGICGRRVGDENVTNPQLYVIVIIQVK